MASKKNDGLLGPDGRAAAQAFSGLGQKWNEYTRWRAEREKRIQKKNSEANKPKDKPKPKPESKKSGNIPASQRPSDYRQGQVYGNDSRSHGRNWSNPHGQVSNKPSEGDRSTWGKPKPKPKPETPKPSPKPKPESRPRNTSTRTSPTPATSSNGQSLRQGRTPPKPTNKPKPAGKVYGSTGRKDLKQSARMADALKTLKVRDYGGSKKKPAAKKPAATKPEPTVSRPKPPASLSKPKPAATKPKPTATKPKPTATKPKPTARKPLVVPPNQIPKNLNSPAGRKYIADLDAGKLTRKKK